MGEDSGSEAVLPPRQRDEVAAFTQRVAATLGDNLFSLMLYGSAVRGGFDAKHSDLNVLIIQRNL